MNIVFNLSSDFWKLNPQFKLLEESKELINNKKLKHSSSQIMWAIMLLVHPESLYYNLSEKERLSTINREYLKDNEYDLYIHKDLIKRIKDLLTTPAKRQLLQWNRIMDEKSEFMEKTSYDDTTWEMLEKMMSSNSKLYQELQRISDMLEREGDTGIIKGGGEQSASEKGLI